MWRRSLTCAVLSDQVSCRPVPSTYVWGLAITLSDVLEQQELNRRFNSFCNLFGTAPSNVRGRTARCARGVPALCEKSAILDLLPPVAKVTAVTTVFPHAGLLRLLLSPKTEIMSSNQLYFPLVPTSTRVGRTNAWSCLNIGVADKGCEATDTLLGRGAGGRAVLNGKKKVFRYTVFPKKKKSPRALHVFNHGWWRLAIGGWRSPGGRVYPKVCNYCIRLYPRL